jgi:hypothetical protein
MVVHPRHHEPLACAISPNGNLKIRLIVGALRLVIGVDDPSELEDRFAPKPSSQRNQFRSR